MAKKRKNRETSITDEAVNKALDGNSTTASSNEADSPERVVWSKQKRIIISVILLVHLLAIFSAPFAGPPAPSGLARRIHTIFEPYLRATYMNHGYRFFAPSPGPSHLLRFEIQSGR